MSEVNARDRADYASEIRRMREAYQAQESEAAKRNKTQNKKQISNQNQEIERLKKLYETQIEELNQKQRETLTKRDQDHNSEIQKLRDLYSDQLRNKTDSNRINQQELRRTFETELQKNKNISEQQKNVLKNNFENSLNNYSEKVESIQSNSQEKIQNELQKRTEIMNKKIDQETRLVRQERDEKVNELYQKNNKNRDFFNKELNYINKQKETEITRLKSRFEENHKNQGLEYQAIADSRDFVLQEERKKLIEETNQKQIQNQEIADNALENLRATVEERYNNKVRSMESDLSRVKSDRVVDMVTQQRIQNLGRKQLVSDYEKRMELLNTQAKEGKEEVLGQSRKKIDKILKENGELIHSTNLRNRQENNLLKNQTKDDRTYLESFYKEKLDFEQSSADRRLDRLTHSMREQSESEKVFYDKNVNAMRESFIDKLQTQRETKIDELRGIQVRAEKKLKEMDKRYQDRADQTVRFYESQISSMKDEQASEKNKLANLYNQKVKDLQKSNKETQESLVTKYESRMAQTQDNHEKEIDRIERRYQEQMTSLNNRLKYANRGKA